MPALLHHTTRLKVIAAIIPGPWNYAVAAKQIASIDHYSNGRIALNIVSGWFKGEFTALEEWWLEHAERYRRSRDFIQALKGIWTAPDDEGFTFGGDFYRFRNYYLSPKPLQKPHPEIFQGGNSGDARDNAATVSDWYFMNGNNLEGFPVPDPGRPRTGRENWPGRPSPLCRDGFVIVRDTEEEAVQVLRGIQGKADAEAVNALRDAVQQAGASTREKTGMWANSEYNDLVQYNDGFKTRLIGTAEQIADRVLLLKSLGVNLVITAFLHYDEEIQLFGTKVLPLVRGLEKQGRGTNTDEEIGLIGPVYGK
ncbi:hypothetical protein GJ744_005057 [Endocarpon pusillum]|uniref:Luciferase-like domain-containing protein n=1 Tax=Endocarpon pusillum TaxID=364733 RepID=A0A8H7AU48_9EURO|nr:hypothetical protein GJ744_005057 [Endocarpon pusillum]